MTPEGKRKFNTYMGSLFLVLGLIAWVLAIFIATTPATAKPAPVNGTPTIDLNSCRQALTRMKYSAEVKGKDIVVRESLSESADEDAIRRQLEKATIGSTMCKLSLKAFCMGEACEDPAQLTFVLTRNKIIVEEEPASSSVKP